MKNICDKKQSTTLLEAVKMVIARRATDHREPAIATEREVAALRGRPTTEEEIAEAAELAVGETFYERYYVLRYA